MFKGCMDMAASRNLASEMELLAPSTNRDDLEDGLVLDDGLLGGAASPVAQQLFPETEEETKAAAAAGPTLGVAGGTVLATPLQARVIGLGRYCFVLL